MCSCCPAGRHIPSTLPPVSIGSNTSAPFTLPVMPASKQPSRSPNASPSSSNISPAGGNSISGEKMSSRDNVSPTPPTQPMNTPSIPDAVPSTPRLSIPIHSLIGSPSSSQEQRSSSVADLRRKAREHTEALVHRYPGGELPSPPRGYTGRASMSPPSQRQ